MHSLKTLTFTLLACLFFVVANAQETTTEEDDKLSLTEGTIDNQFEYVIQKSYNYQEYKNVKKKAYVIKWQSFLLNKCYNSNSQKK